MGFLKQILESLYNPTVHINMQLSESTPRNEYEVTSTLSQKTDRSFRIYFYMYKKADFRD